MDNNEVRAYTREEVRGEFLTSLYVNQSILDKQKKCNGLDIAYLVFNKIDQGEPLFKIIPEYSSEDIAGVLHSLILSSSEQLEAFEKSGKYHPVQKAIVNKVKQLALEYDLSQTNNSHELIADILRIFDQGIYGVGLELKAMGNPEDIEYYKSLELNYYPEQGENIAGKLALQYTRIVEACKQRNGEVNSMFLVPKAEITPPKQM